MEQDKALDMAVSQIEKQFGTGAIMKMGEGAIRNVRSIPTGALSLDIALGIGGVPRGPTCIHRPNDGDRRRSKTQRRIYIGR